MNNRWQQGCLYQAHGAWHVRYYHSKIVDAIPTRAQRSERLCDEGTPKKRINQLFAEFMAKINDQNPEQQSTDLTVVKFWDDVYQPFVLQNFKPSTAQGYIQIWNQHLKTHFGEKLLREYRTPMMSVFLTKLAKTYRPRTLNHIKWLASAVFAHAINIGDCETNPIRDAKVLGKTLPDGVTGVYTLEEIENIITALVEHPECQLVMALAYFLGLRKGEIQALQWGDVDEDFVHVRRNITKGVGGLHTTTPKTKKSVRDVPLIQPVRGLLTLWRSKNPDGVFVCSSNLTTLSKVVIIPTLRKAKLTWRGYHAGRRGLGTKMRELTGNSNAGRDLLGHSTSQITEAHYEAAMPEETLKGMRLLEAKLLEAKVGK
jgi:integrase